MGLYTLRMSNGDTSSGVLEGVKNDSVSYEKDFENWLENSPNVLLDENDEETLFWIGRQAAASVGDTDKYPDLIGIDSSGDLVIVELKKGRTPRDIIAQILEYTTWASGLTYEDLNIIALNYYKKQDCNFEKSLQQIYQEVFYPDSEDMPEVQFNKNQKLYIVAEEISPVVRQVASHLRTKYRMNISCLEYHVLKSKQGEFFISTEKTVGFDNLAPKTPDAIRAFKVKDVISDAVNRLTQGSRTILFSPADVYIEIKKQYPDINRSTVGCQIIQDCVNHSSRKHYPSGQRDLYYKVDKGKFRLYDPVADGQWNFKGERIS
ncbi:MAG: hypothetical protein JL50_00890 [Peptococcaceae bacterium BICA1-7]|nr:MAG: hypothetical protein JL50_00890 [Peptococcaceae bacterium BICA1-7]HBV98054.1 hypothetical protein [Desulfotomaculum sp.]